MLDGRAKIKDSTVMLHIAFKALRPGSPPPFASPGFGIAPFLWRAFALPIGSNANTRSHDWPVRTGVLILAFALLLMRTPLYFIDPQLWAEDGTFLLAQAYASGWHSLLAPIGGYLLLPARLVAFAGNALPLAAAPWLYLYVATAVLLLGVWLVTSPRLDLPYKPICALALASVPAGFEIFGGLANSQWALGLAGFILPFMRPPESKLS